MAGRRRRVASAPQFRMNHVFAETLAFNLLMGRNWRAQALRANRVRRNVPCRKLPVYAFYVLMQGGPIRPAWGLDRAG